MSLPANLFRLARVAGAMLAFTSVGAHAAGRPAPTAAELAGVPQHFASVTEVQHALKAAAADAVQKSGTDARHGAPLRFAVEAALPLALADGVWDAPEAGVARWRTQVASVGAETLSLQFAGVALPAGAELWLYDVNGAVLQGPYTQADVTPEGRLFTALIAADTAVAELRVPAAAQGSVRLQLAQAHHGFVPFAKMGERTQKSGSCNVDAICAAADAWGDERRAATMLTINNSFLCSGQLVNNVRGDERPLLLTANHCNAGANAAAVITYFNYQSSRCGGTPNGSLANNVSGAKFLAGDVSSDFTLLELARKPDASWNAFYAGWNAGAAVPQSGAVFHHPQGDEKRVSTYASAAARAPVRINDNLVQAWAVKWSAGVTESGSSGSGLYNEQRQLVGVLSGGEASCANPTGTDYFARLETAWTASVDPAGQLKAHLDPDATGTLSIAGRSMSSPATAPVASTPAPAETPAAAPAPASPAPAASASAASGGGSGGGGGGSFGALALLVLGAARVLRRRG